MRILYEPTMILGSIILIGCMIYISYNVIITRDIWAIKKTRIIMGVVVISMIFLFLLYGPIQSNQLNNTNAIDKFSKEIENKEIVDVEMGVSDFGIIESVTYIDDDGAKTKIDCSDLSLPRAHVKESDDKKYHITIIEDKDITVYIPISKEYTTK